jgi:hypothetical protein
MSEDRLPDVTEEVAAWKQARRKQRVPDLAKLAEHEDPEIASWARELIASARILKAFVPLSPEKRRRVLRAAWALYGIEP